MTSSLARRARTWGGNGLTTAVGLATVALCALVVVVAEQNTAREPARSAFSARDTIEIQQLARTYAWALDGGDDHGYAYADLFTPDGVFVGMNQAPAGRSYQGRDVLAALARGGTRGATHQRHFTMNHVITPTSEGATGRVYVVMLDVGVVGTPNGVSHGGHYEDVYERTDVGWRFKRRTYWESKVDVWPEGVAK